MRRAKKSWSDQKGELTRAFPFLASAKIPEALLTQLLPATNAIVGNQNNVYINGATVDPPRTTSKPTKSNRTIAGASHHFLVCRRNAKNSPTRLA